MADTLSLEVKASLAWLFQDTIDLSIVSDSSKLEYSKSLVDGTAADQADKLWHDQRTVSAGANDDLDLTSLAQTLFGGSISMSFAKIKALLVVNLAATAGENLLLGGAGAGAQAWGAPFNNDQNAKLGVPADSVALLVNKKAGWTVTNGSSDVLRIANAGSGAITYKIVIAGTSS